MKLISDKILAYVSNIEMMSNSTAKEYKLRLNSLKDFIVIKYEISVELLIEQI